MSSNEQKMRLLGMPFGTATARLRKSLLFRMAQRLGEDTCYRCQRKIQSESEFSIEHKLSWATSDTPVELFFSPENIAFSHIICNVGSGVRDRGPRVNHGTNTRYTKHGCRCAECKSAGTSQKASWRESSGKH